MDSFLSSNIKCISCGSGPINFSILWNENHNKLISKYGDYCSMGCIMSYHNSDERNKSRPVTSIKKIEIGNKCN